MDFLLNFINFNYNLVSIKGSEKFHPRLEKLYPSGQKVLEPMLAAVGPCTAFANQPWPSSAQGLFAHWTEDCHPCSSYLWRQRNSRTKKHAHIHACRRTQRVSYTQVQTYHRLYPNVQKAIRHSRALANSGRHRPDSLCALGCKLNLHSCSKFSNNIIFATYVSKQIGSEKIQTRITSVRECDIGPYDQQLQGPKS